MGEIILSARLKKGLSQDALAEKLGTKRQTIIGWEKDRHRPSRYAEPVSEELEIPLVKIRAAAGGTSERLATIEENLGRLLEERAAQERVLSALDVRLGLVEAVLRSDGRLAEPG